MTEEVVARFPMGSVVRYRPGTGTYGYESVTESDGCVPGVVIGYSTTRVRVRFVMEHGRTQQRAVNPDSLCFVVGARA